MCSQHSAEGIDLYIRSSFDVREHDIPVHVIKSVRYYQVLILRYAQLLDRIIYCAQPERLTPESDRRESVDAKAIRHQARLGASAAIA